MMRPLASSLPRRHPAPRLQAVNHIVDHICEPIRFAGTASPMGIFEARATAERRTIEIESASKFLTPHPSGNSIGVIENLDHRLQTN